MIRGFKGKFAEAIFAERRIPKGFPSNLAKGARSKLVQLNAAAVLGDLAAPPRNCLEQLKAIGKALIRSASTIDGGLFLDGPGPVRRTSRSWIIIHEQKACARASRRG